MRGRRLTAMVGLLVILAACSAGAQPPASNPGQPAPTSEGGYVDVPPARLAEMLAAKDFTFVNVHVPYEGEIARTDLFIPYDQVDGLLGALPDRDAKVVLYCRSGSMSTIAAEALVAAGYTNVWSLDGGMNAWRAEGYPVTERPPG